MSDLVHVRHLVSGVVSDEPRNIVEHSVLGRFFEEVGPNAKPYLPEMHRVTLPAEPTADEVAVAIQAGFITEDEAKEIVITEEKSTKTEDKK